LDEEGALRRVPAGSRTPNPSVKASEGFFSLDTAIHGGLSKAMMGLQATGVLAFLSQEVLT
jgi:hypothetical protein